MRASVSCCRPAHLLPASALLTVLAAPAQAAATLSGGSFGAGFSGPLVILVHLLGLLALGLWASGLGGKGEGQVPGIALAALLIFGLLHQWGVRIPYVGLVLEVSLVVLGLLVALDVGMPLIVGLVLAVIAGAAHGAGLSGGGGGIPLLYWLGALAGAALSLCAGIGLAALLTQAVSRGAVRGTGAAIALIGLLMLLNLL